MDRANYHLAWHLAEHLGRTVHLAAHRVVEPLSEHPLVRVHHVPRPLGLHALGAPLLDAAGRRLARRLRRLSPRTRIVVNGGNCLCPAVNWVHMVQHACAPADAGAPWSFRLKNRLSRVRERAREHRALAASRLVVANSEKTRRELVSLVGVPPDRAFVVYLGVDPEEFRPATPQTRLAARAALGLPAARVVFLFAGALGYDRNKGFDTLLLAWRRLCAAGEAPGLLVAAGGGRLEFWKRQVDELGLTASVRLAGQTGRVAELMAAADVFVSPTRYDAYGLAVHEALCCGIPTLVSRAAGVAERYPAELSDFLLPDPEDPHDLATRLHRCGRESEAHRRRIAPFAAALRARTWEQVSREMIDLIEAHS
jgi:glycosyltransferase involved in cell wall biosynthesis